MKTGSFRFFLDFFNRFTVFFYYNSASRSTSTRLIFFSLKKFIIHSFEKIYIFFKTVMTLKLTEMRPSWRSGTSLRTEMKYFYFLISLLWSMQNVAHSSATQHVMPQCELNNILMPQEFGGKSEMEVP